MAPMNFIKKIYEGNGDALTHMQFRRFSKGIFENRALVDLTVKGKKVKVKTSFEFAPEFALYLAQTIDGTTHVTGAVITLRDLDFGFDVEKKQFAGVKRYILDHDFGRDQLLGLMHDNPEALFLLSFSTLYGSLKTKAKSPKSGKPGKDDEEPKADFCTFITNDTNFVREFTFDVSQKFAHFYVKHTFIIEKLVVPHGVTDYLEMRAQAQREGIIRRIKLIDGVEEVSEIFFSA